MLKARELILGRRGLSPDAHTGWQTRKARELILRPRGLAVWYPSPSEYDPVAFISTLADTLVAAIMSRYARRVFRPFGAFLIETVLVVAILFALFPFTFSRFEDAAWTLERPFVGVPDVSVWSLVHRSRASYIDGFHHPSFTAVSSNA